MSNPFDELGDLFHAIGDKIKEVFAKDAPEAEAAVKTAAETVGADAEAAAGTVAQDAEKAAEAAAPAVEAAVESAVKDA